VTLTGWNMRRWKLSRNETKSTSIPIVGSQQYISIITLYDSADVTIPHNFRLKILNKPHKQHCKINTCIWSFYHWRHLHYSTRGLFLHNSITHMLLLNKKHHKLLQRFYIHSRKKMCQIFPKHLHGYYYIQTKFARCNITVQMSLNFDHVPIQSATSCYQTNSKEMASKTLTMNEILIFSLYWAGPGQICWNLGVVWWHGPGLTSPGCSLVYTWYSQTRCHTAAWLPRHTSHC